MSGSPAVPIIYYVERFRERRSYTTRRFSHPVIKNPVYQLNALRYRESCSERCSDLRTYVLFPQTWAVAAFSPMAHAAECTNSRGVRVGRNHDGTPSCRGRHGREHQEYIERVCWGERLSCDVLLSWIIIIVTNVPQERARSPIAIKTAKSHEVAADGTITYMYWMGARNLGSKYETPFQKVKTDTLLPDSRS